MNTFFVNLPDPLTAKVGGSYTTPGKQVGMKAQLARIPSNRFQTRGTRRAFESATPQACQ
jgi:hypothetical protein